MVHATNFTRALAQYRHVKISNIKNHHPSEEMASSSRIPHLLESYLALPPEASLILLTSVLGASSNWLTLRHVYSYLRGSAERDEGARDTGVVLVSFMRDGAFWREGATKMVGFWHLFFFANPGTLLTNL